MILNKKHIIPLFVLSSLLFSCGPTSTPTTTLPTDPSTETSTVEPTIDPTIDPTVEPTVDPIVDPTVDPTIDPTVEPSKDPTTNPSVGKEGELTVEEFNEKYSMDDFFSYENKIKVQINMSKNEVYRLSEDYDAYPHHSSPIYRACDVILHINNDFVKFNKAAIRLKGNTSRRKFADQNGRIYANVHFKIDFNEIIDYVDYESGEEEVIDERTFLGLKKLDLKWNKNFDTSHVKEYVASKLYKEYDVKSQAIGFTQVKLNDTNLGLYYSYETIDKHFTKRHYSKAENGGDLYKACYTAAGPADLTYGKVGQNIGEEDEEANQKNGFFPSYDIKTNKDETDHSKLLNLIDVLNKNSTTIKNIEDVVDLNQFIKYEAVSYVLGDPDDFRNNYNNTYIYFNKETGKAEFIPYDKDRMFGTQCDWNPTGNGMTQVNPLSNWSQGAGKEQANQLYKKILSRPISGADTYVSTYMNLVKEIFNSSKTLAKFDEVYEVVKDLYNDIVRPDNDMRYAEFKTSDDINLTFDKYITAKKSHFTNKYNEWNK
jgi:spore coat protein CotH